jgi:hypothetical protein
MENNFQIPFSLIRPIASPTFLFFTIQRISSQSWELRGKLANVTALFYVRFVIWKEIICSKRNFVIQYLFKIASKNAQYKKSNKYLIFKGAKFEAQKSLSEQNWILFSFKADFKLGLKMNLFESTKLPQNWV